MTDAFQSVVNVELGFGIVGEVINNGPRRGNVYELNSDDATKNVIGRAFTILTSDSGNGQSSGTVRAGGTGAFAGILANPKSYASLGTNSDTLAPTLTLPNATLAEFLYMAEMVIAVPGACNIGDDVYYDTTTGVLGTLPPSVTGTLSQSTTTVTVAASPSSNNLGVGSKLQITGAEPATILALGTGTGGAGTYTVDVSQTVSGGTAFTANSVVPSGKAFVPHTKIVRYSETGAGLAVASLTN